MPKNTNDHRDLTPEEIAAREEKFRSFFTTTAVNVPVEMTRRDDEPQKPKKRFGLFGHNNPRREAEEPADTPLEMPTGEVLLGADAQPEEEADLELVLKPTADPEPETSLRPLAEQQPVAAAQPEPPAPEKEPERPTEPAKMPEPEAPAQPEKKPEPQEQPAPRAEKPAKAAKQPKPRNAKNAPEVLLPQEQQEQQEMAELKAMIGLGGKAPAPKPAPAKQPEKAAEPKDAAMPAVVFAAAKDLPKEPAEKPSIFEMFGTPEDEQKPEAPAAQAEKQSAPGKEDTMSLPLLPLDEETAGAENVEETASTEKAQNTERAEAQPQEESTEPAAPAEEAEPAPPETPAEKLRRMGAELTLRCALAGILAVVLLHFGLVSDRLLPALNVLDPDAAPAAFYGANLLLFAASLCVGWPVLRDGLKGLRERPSAEAMPALAAAAALLQAVTAMLNANTYHNTEGISLLTGVAALGLFFALLGGRVMLAAVKGGYELIAADPEHRGAYRAKDKDLLRALTRDLDQKDLWVLLSRPLQAADGFVEQCLGERASERRAQKTARILLGAAVLSGMLFVLFGAGWNKAVAAMAAVLCLGAPLSSTLIAGLASLRLQRAAAAVGAVVPGWRAIEQLGGIDTLQVDADDLFTADSALLEDIRIFKGGRIDRAILYAASVLNAGCGTLQGLFRQIVEDRTDILFPMKDLEEHNGLGFVGWCDNNRILIGNRKYLEQEGVPLPDEEYEAEHSKNGELQILYLAVSGSLHAMFVLRYVGGRNTARSLAALQKENIRLLVTCRDPSLTARHISEAYHLPEGMVTLLDQEQCDAIAAAPIDPADPCCMIHAQNFASLTGGLQAADQAQNAETSATTVQLVSVWFSIVIALLLTSAGSIWQLSVATALMYQAAWSALSIAVCALKQHN